MTMNPFSFLRTKAGYTQKRFGADFGFAKQTLIAIESGMYPELSERMVVSISAACERAGLDAGAELADHYDTPYLAVAYSQWREAERGQMTHLINVYRPTLWTNTRSPMSCFIDNTVGSLQGFAKRLKVPPATLARYAQGKQRMMPSRIEAALRAVDYPYLSELIAVQANWSDENG